MDRDSKWMFTKNRSEPIEDKIKRMYALQESLLNLINIDRNV